MRGAARGKRGHELVAVRRYGLGIQPGRRQLLEIEKVIGPAGAHLLEPGIHVAPAIGHVGEEGDAFGRDGFAHEGREIRGQGRERQLVDGAMADVIPGEGRKGKGRGHDGRGEKAGGGGNHWAGGGEGGGGRRAASVAA